MCGVVGPIEDCIKLKAWADANFIPDKFPTVSQYGYLIVVHPNGEVTRYTASGQPFISHNKKLALGTGRDFAYGAMFMGATAEEAVRAAIKYCASCSGEVLKLRREA